MIQKKSSDLFGDAPKAKKAPKEAAQIIEGTGHCLPERPPGHPDLRYAVTIPLGAMSVSFAVECGYLDEAVKAKCRKLLDDYMAGIPSLDSPEVQAWVRIVLGRFKTRYRPAKDTQPIWSMSSLEEHPDWDQMAHVDRHAGVVWIRSFYPDFTPTAEQFSAKEKKDERKPDSRSDPFGD
jgi:hypothetical protein